MIRGFALCGILLANVQPIANRGPALLTDPHHTGPDALGLFVDHRFFPIFSVLFGIGFALLLESAQARAARPRLVLLRRLVVLLAIGAAHFLLLWQGDILSTYAILGLVILLPASWLPRWLVAALAPVFVGVALVLGDSRFILITGLFLGGAALVRYGVVARLEQSIRVPLIIGLSCAVAAVPASWWQLNRPEDPTAPIVAGLLVAGVYVSALLLLLRSGLGPALRVIFAPLGRMALTNYLAATVLVLIISLVIGDKPEAWPLTTVLAVAAAILVLQWIWSTLWLRRFQFGPVEWLWRWTTWLRRPPLRRAAPQPRRAS